jgi:hypothetical protein
MLQSNYNLLVIDTVLRPAYISAAFRSGVAALPRDFPGQPAHFVVRSLPASPAEKRSKKLCTSAPGEFSFAESSRTTLNAEKQEESQCDASQCCQFACLP